MERAERLFQCGPRRRFAGALRRGALLLAVGLSLASTGASAQTDRTFEAFEAAARREIEAGRIPGAVVLFGRDGHVTYRRAFGSRLLEPMREPLDPEAMFDLASVTKVVATTTAVMQLVEAGRLDLDRPVAAYWPAFARNDKAAITPRQLLTHASGLPADLDLSEPWSGEAEGLARAAAARPTSPPGAAFLYSDINFIVLGELVRRISGEPLDVYARRHIFGPLGMTETGFRPDHAVRLRIAATDREGGMLRWGVVHDPTASRMGGVAGHAGLFSTADDLARFAQMLLDGGVRGGVRILRPETVALMTHPVELPGGTRRALGWDVASPYSAGMDAAFGPAAYGHTGYTGCLLWIDPARRRFLIVLTSRLHPDGRGDAMPLRRELARVISDVEGMEATRTGTQP